MTRVALLREMMEERGYDAVVLRNNPDLRWLTGAERAFDDECAHTAFITASELRFHTDSRYYNTFVERLGKDSVWQLDQERISATQWVAARVLESRARVVAIEDTLTLAFYDALQTELAKASIAPALPRMHSDIQRMRMVKDTEELELLMEAQKVTDAAFEHMCDFIRPGQTEQQICLELNNYMLAHGADGISFETIIASGPNGANPHARPGDRVVREGDMIVMDYGALVHDYHADMTRTVCVGEPSAYQREVYDIVRRAHEECAELAMPDVNGKSVHEHSVKVISEAGFGDYYGHGLGHGVGLEIHELPGFGRSWDKPVPAGSVITIEPGIYLPGEFGVRIEDCGVVTESGFVPFTNLDHELRIVGV